VIHHLPLDLRKIKSFFRVRIISKGLLTPRSLDMSLLDIFLWDLLKGLVFKHKLHTADGLKRNTTNKTAETFANMECCASL
jgi:hypothetical protein